MFFCFCALLSFLLDDISRIYVLSSHHLRANELIETAVKQLFEKRTDVRLLCLFYPFYLNSPFDGDCVANNARLFIFGKKFMLRFLLFLFIFLWIARQEKNIRHKYKLRSRAFYGSMKNCFCLGSCIERFANEAVRRCWNEEKRGKLPRGNGKSKSERNEKSSSVAIVVLPFRPAFATWKFYLCLVLLLRQALQIIQGVWSLKFEVHLFV